MQSVIHSTCCSIATGMLQSTDGLPAASGRRVIGLTTPSVGAANVIFSFTVVMLVSLASTFYPALIAARIQPVVAMSTEE